MYPAPISFGSIPALSIASTDACSAISVMLSCNLPYFVLPTPITQTFSTNLADYIPYKNSSLLFFDLIVSMTSITDHIIQLNVHKQQVDSRNSVKITKGKVTKMKTEL